MMAAVKESALIDIQYSFYTTTTLIDTFDSSITAFRPTDKPQIASLECTVIDHTRHFIITGSPTSSYDF